jgi:hypothetical protein
LLGVYSDSTPLQQTTTPSHLRKITMLNRRQQLCCYYCIFLLTSVLCSDLKSTPSPTKGPSKRYPVRTFLGNMYHRFRNNRTPLVLIPPLIRLAYQYGGPLLERMSSAFGLSGAAGQTAAGAAASGGIDSLVESAISGAMGGGGAAGAAGQAVQGLGQLPFAGLPPGMGGFGAAPMAGFGARPVFFRRKRR